ncbi:DUF805 domain-containing protein [Patescibacteria group bacterium]|nr:DUF805 domain-containing protein [Patescibacteria group bacterium]
MNNYTSVLKKYSEFSGRAGRSEYWYFVLVNFTISVGLAILNSSIGSNSNFLGTLYSLIVLLPGIAVSIRRLHDIGKSGWMLLVSLIPVVGFVWILILMATDGNPEENEYGPAIY